MMKEKMMRFLSGRYGNDDLNRFLVALEFVLLILSLFLRNIVWQLLFYAVILLYFYRALSRNYVARSIENQKFVKWKTKIIHSGKAVQKDMNDKGYKHFVCPQCAQIVRVPKGKGKIEITCPSCRNRFEKKS